MKPTDNAVRDARGAAETLASWEAEAEAAQDVLHVDHFEPDVICLRCGSWKSEHCYDLCQSPEWLGSDD